MRARLSLLLIAGGPLLGAPGHAFAQEALPPGIEIVANEAAGEQGPEAAAAIKPGNDPGAAMAAKRLQKLQQLVFDRRPSSILRAWAAPDLKPFDPAEEQTDKAKQGQQDNAGSAEPGGAGANAAGGDAAAQLRTVLGGAPTAAGPALTLRPAAGPAATVPARSAPAAAPVTVSGQPMTRAEMERLLAQQFGTPPGAAAPAAPATAPEAAGAGAPADPYEAKRLQREMEMLQRDVTLGRWDNVGKFVAQFPQAQQKTVYELLLQKLPAHPQTPQTQRIPPNLQEKNRFSFGDALALAGLAPGGFAKQQAKLLAPVVSLALEAGSVPEELVRLLQLEVNRDAAQQRLDRREAALLLAELGQEAELGVFLPTATEAEKDNDREALNLLARHALAMYAKEQRRAWLETAWQVTQAALAKGEVGKEEKEEALRRAVELAPKVREDLGPAWLAESFTKRPDRGMEIVATIGGQVAKGFEERAQDVVYRTAGLELQKSAVDALLEKAPQLAEEWRPTLGLLASGWIVEASYSYQFSQATSFGPVMERDDFGNIFWSNRRRGGGGQIQALEPADVLKSQPGKTWAALLDESLRPHFAAVSAQLWLKVNEYDKAFPFIEQLAAINPRKAKDLAHEFLRVWMRSNNPNVDNRTNAYMFMYGFDRRANGIPLTRSKQQRNLEELGSYVERLRQLPIGRIDEKLLGEAFIAAHSVAEVYRLDTIERVFGDVSQLDPVLLATLIGTMRTNLATIWRMPAVQEEQQTKRSQKEMLEEVARGYATALKIAQDALVARGRHWALLGAVATILHDQNNFAKELKRDSGFSETRQAAFDLFAEGADHYASIADGLRLDEETTQPFTQWFYAALGAADLGAVDEETVLARSQLPKIRAAIDALPDGSRERHLGMFANELFTRMSAVRPQVKYRYLDAGFAIVGDHPQAAEAKKVWDYYQDLIRELRLEAVVDGSTAVGTKPFGVRIDIVHSPEIERESGGFQKYTTNQNDQRYAYNYGRPLENYRDKFHDAAIAALQENFEVLSVTFNSEAMSSKPTDAPGWRRTPYAWLLLQARGPQVDRVPTIKLDFDFLDTSGFTILPIGTSPVVIDASAKAEARPFHDLEVTQLLDERRIDEGKVTLEIKAKSKGLVPELGSVLALDTPGFVVDKRDDQGASVVQFADDQDHIVSERVWLLSLAPESSGARPGSFRFGRPLDASAKALFQRYNDADLQTVSAEVALSGVARARDPLWVWLLVVLAGVLYTLWFCFARPRRGGSREAVATLAMPRSVTPFTVLALLQQIGARARLDEAARRQLAADMQRIEACHFGRDEDPDLDLVELASGWLRRAG